VKALSIKQPWASFIAHGHKRVETRSWRTRHRGPITIHASRPQSRAQQRRAYAEFAASPPLHALVDQLCEGDLHRLPHGAMIAVARLVDVSPVRDWLELFPGEEPLGNFAPGRFGWLLEDVQMLPEPLPIAGKLDVWSVPPAIAAQLPGATTTPNLPDAWLTATSGARPPHPRAPPDAALAPPRKPREEPGGVLECTA
jgi:hypothetical protein